MSACRVTLTPFSDGAAIEKVLVRYELDDYAVPAGGELFRAQLNTVSVPGAEPLDAAVWDAGGPVACETGETASYPIVYRHWIAKRDAAGPVTIQYTVLPCEGLRSGRHGPYFRFAREAGGVNGPGLAFLVDLPGWTGSVSLHWDLSHLPKGSRGVCAWGEGDAAKEGSLDTLRQIYYAFGRVQALTEGDFGFYWLTEPPFDVRALADLTRKLFGIMRDFFRDDQKAYRIFMRRDFTETSGGTALERSYMFGWNDRQPVSVEGMLNLLAHEMVHNWPHLHDEPYGVTTWYAEGTAEYYSVMIPLRHGLITREQALSEIQKRTDGYYTNPTRHLSNMEAAKVCWQDRRAQRLSYGRGIFFLANTDAKIIRATDGRRSIDDVVLDILEQGRRGAALGNEVFLETVKRVGGIDVTGDWRVMHEGGHFAPDPDSFGGLFSVTEEKALEADTGMDALSYRWALR